LKHLRKQRPTGCRAVAKAAHLQQAGVLRPLLQQRQQALTQRQHRLLHQHCFIDAGCLNVHSSGSSGCD
jgi:hypothetical protein